MRDFHHRGVVCVNNDVCVCDDTMVRGSIRLCGAPAQVCGSYCLQSKVKLPAGIDLGPTGKVAYVRTYFDSSRFLDMRYEI